MYPVGKEGKYEQDTQRVGKFVYTVSVRRKVISIRERKA